MATEDAKPGDDANPIEETRPIDIKTLTAAALISLVLFLVLAGAFFYWTEQHPVKFGYVDVAQLVQQREQMMVKRLEAGPTLTEADRKKEIQGIMDFARSLDAVLGALPEECDCIVLNRGAFVAGSKVEDYTPWVKNQLGMP